MCMGGTNHQIHGVVKIWHSFNHITSNSTLKKRCNLRVTSRKRQALSLPSILDETHSGAGGVAAPATSILTMGSWMMMDGFFMGDSCGCNLQIFTVHIYIYVYIYIWLVDVGGLEDLDYFFHSVGNVIIPTDELIFFTGVQKPPTSTVYNTCILALLWMYSQLYPILLPSGVSFMASWDNLQRT